MFEVANRGTIGLSMIFTKINTLKVSATSYDPNWTYLSNPFARKVIVPLLKVDWDEIVASDLCSK